MNCKQKWTYRALSRSCCFSWSSCFKLSTSTFSSMFWNRLQVADNQSLRQSLNPSLLSTHCNYSISTIYRRSLKWARHRFVWAGLCYILKLLTFKKKTKSLMSPGKLKLDGEKNQKWGNTCWASSWTHHVSNSWSQFEALCLPRNSSITSLCCRKLRLRV